MQSDLISATQALQAGRLRDAEKYCRRALAEHPSNPAGLHLLGVVAGRTGRHDVAADLITVKGVGPVGLKRPQADVDLGNSGTALRLLTGLLAGQNVEATLTGDESLRKRPMQRVEEPLNKMGADVAASRSGVPPVRIR